MYCIERRGKLAAHRIPGLQPSHSDRCSTGRIRRLARRHRHWRSDRPSRVGARGARSRRGQHQWRFITHKRAITLKVLAPKGNTIDRTRRLLWRSKAPKLHAAAPSIPNDPQRNSPEVEQEQAFPSTNPQVQGIRIRTYRRRHGPHSPLLRTRPLPHNHRPHRPGSRQSERIPHRHSAG